MIKDVSGVFLTPGNYGKDCLGNGEHTNDVDELIECCCDECDYLVCCLFETNCTDCDEYDCPRKFHRK